MLGAHRTGVRLGVLPVAAGALLLLPEPSTLAIVVVAFLALAAIIGAEILCRTTSGTSGLTSTDWATMV